MVGTVTGIAPYVSIIRDTLHNNIVDNKFFVFQGASYIDEFAYDKELAEYAVRFPEFVKYFPTISRSKEKRNIGWKGIQGRVNDILGSHVEELNLFPDSTLIYTCGHPGMIEDVKSKFSKQGYKVGLIDLDEANLDKVASNIPNSICLPTDITKEESILMSLNKFGDTPDALVNCAGIVRFGKLLEQSTQDFKDVIKNNIEAEDKIK